MMTYEPEDKVEDTTSTDEVVESETPEVVEEKEEETPE